MTTPRALVALGIAALALGGCATPHPVPCDPSPSLAAANSPTSALPSVAQPTTGIPTPTEFASDAGSPASPVVLAGTKPTVPGPAPAPADRPTDAATPEPPAVGLPQPKESKEDKGPTFKLRGRVEADSVTVSQSEKDKVLFGDFQNAVGFRRLRLGSEGTAGEQTRWVAEFDFAGGNVAVRDAFVAVNHLPYLGEIRVGHILEPFSLEGQTRSVWFPFTERSPAFTFDPSRNWGVAFYSHTDDQRLFVQGGLFKSGTDGTGTDVGDQNDLAYTARVVYLPWYEDAADSFRLLHVGGAASQRYAKDNTVTFNQGPQSSLLQSGTDNPRTPFVPTVSIPANQYQLYNLQSALVLGPLSFQAEWSGTRVEQIGRGPVSLNGWYVLASYFLTGEHRSYNREFGTFSEQSVRRPFVCTDGPTAIAQGLGAWELTARLAYLDFDNSNLPPGPNGLPVGTRTTTITLGLNWYLNDNVRIMVDWGHAIPVFPPFGSSTADLVTVRTSVYW